MIRVRDNETSAQLAVVSQVCLCKKTEGIWHGSHYSCSHVPDELMSGDSLAIALLVLGPPLPILSKPLAFCSLMLAVCLALAACAVRLRGDKRNRGFPAQNVLHLQFATFPIPMAVPSHT